MSMKVEQTNIDELIPYASNSRTHSEEQVAQIAASIKEFGFNNPVLLDGDNGIIAGHGRTLAARKLGLKVVPTIELAHLSDSQRKAYIIADNKLALNAGWDMELLSLEMGDLKDEGFDLSLLGFDDTELANIFVKKTEGLTDPDAVPDMPDNPVTKEGDVWLLGKHRLMCADSSHIDAIDKLMGGESANCVITDPPYNQETDGGFKGNIGKSLRKQAADIEHLCNFEPGDFLGVLPTVFKSGKMNATIFCNKDLVPNYLNWANEAGYSFNILIWKKPNAIPLGGSYQPDIEYMLVLRKSATFNTKVEGVKYSKVLAFDRETGLHPTMKPVGLIENQMKITSNAGDRVVDLFCGSGSTIIAGEMTGRAIYAMELSPAYVDVAVKRWQDFTGRQAILETTQEPFKEVA